MAIYSSDHSALARLASVVPVNCHVTDVNRNALIYSAPKLMACIPMKIALNFSTCDVEIFLKWLLERANHFSGGWLLYWGCDERL